jgi:hypothetical protein
MKIKCLRLALLCTCLVLALQQQCEFAFVSDKNDCLRNALPFIITKCSASPTSPVSLHAPALQPHADNPDHAKHVENEIENLLSKHTKRMHQQQQYESENKKQRIAKYSYDRSRMEYDYQRRLEFEARRDVDVEKLRKFQLQQRQQQRQQQKDAFEQHKQNELRFQQINDSIAKKLQTHEMHVIQAKIDAEIEAQAQASQRRLEMADLKRQQSKPQQRLVSFVSDSSLQNIMSFQQRIIQEKSKQKSNKKKQQSITS